MRALDHRVTRGVVSTISPYLLGKSNLEPSGYHQCHLTVKDGTSHNEPGPAVSSSKRALGKRTFLPRSSIVMQTLPEVKRNGKAGAVMQ